MLNKLKRMITFGISPFDNNPRFEFYHEGWRYYFISFGKYDMRITF